MDSDWRRLEWHDSQMQHMILDWLFPLRRKILGIIKWNLDKWHTRVFHQFRSVQFSHSVTFGSLQPHGLQHTRLSCPLPTPGVYSNSCPLSRWWCPTISSSVIPFSSCLLSFLASGSFPRSQFFTSGGQSLELQLKLHTILIILLLRVKLF